MPSIMAAFLGISRTYKAERSSGLRNWIMEKISMVTPIKMIGRINKRLIM
jgi:hypothetical protein